MLRLFLAVLAALVLLSGCSKNESASPETTASPESAETPGRAQVQFLDDLYDGRLDSAYAKLHPAYQRIVSQKRFVRCTRAIKLGKLGSVHVVDVRDDPIDIPGSGTVPAKAVRVRLTSPAGDSTTIVNHEVKVGSHWRWVLNDAAAKAYKAGRCPGA